MMYGMEMKVKTVQLWYMACILIELLRQNRERMIQISIFL